MSAKSTIWRKLVVDWAGPERERRAAASELDEFAERNFCGGQSAGKKLIARAGPKGFLQGPKAILGLKLFFDPLHIAIWFLFHSLKLNFLSICDICKEPVKKPHQSADRPLTILVSLSTTKCMQISSRSNLSRSDRRTRHEASSNRATCSSLMIPPSKYGIRWNRRHRETVSDC